MLRARVADPVVEELRARLEAIDRSLVLTLLAREKTQHELFAYKRSVGLALADPAQERLVRRRARSWALEAGGDPALVADVVTLAVASGKRRHSVPASGSSDEGSPVVVFLPAPHAGAGVRGPVSMRVPPTVAEVRSA